MAKHLKAAALALERVVAVAPRALLGPLDAPPLRQGSPFVVPLEAVLAVGRGLSGAYLQTALERLEHLHAALDVTGGAQADAQPVASGRSEPELSVERGDAEDVVLGELEPPGDTAHGVGREVTERLLRALQHRHEIGGTSFELTHDGRPRIDGCTARVGGGPV